MTQYINKAALVEEIEKRQKEEVFYDEDGSFASWADQNHYSILESIKNVINNLEVKEVDLEKELNEYGYHYDYVSLASRSELINFAKHFFELGLKVKDWKKERMEECPYRQVGCTMYEGKILECRGACSWVVDYPKLKELKTQKGE